MLTRRTNKQKREKLDTYLSILDVSIELIVYSTYFALYNKECNSHVVATSYGTYGVS